MAGLPCHVDERVELQPAQRGQAIGRVAVDPHEPRIALRLTGDTARGARHIVTGRERRADNGPAEKGGPAQYE
ncbi:hypothetical protein GCM10009835_13880 [Planosporangium flavigriseum]|uniref:Uncharacterized protein n=1 Tax=Planosporangium flavigriseum TaxID=373681 RepID=A0A8J3PN10_9ACTN|nr:hypothetical protein Pfl04_32730 [Planosporangium flavigriseum]